MKDILEALPPHLFALASEAERAADKETMEQKRREEFDAPDDCEVWLTFGTLRKIERVFATINCIRTCSPVPAEEAIRCAQQLKHELQDLDFLDLTPNEQNALVVARAFLRSPVPAEDMEARKDAAYLERNQVVAALASVFPSGTARTAIPGWSDDWHGCVYIDLPTGQASWHFHDSHAHLFAHLPPYAGKWDGHTTDEKYARLAALPAVPAEDGLREAREALKSAQHYIKGTLDHSGHKKWVMAAIEAALSSGRDGRKP